MYTTRSMSITYVRWIWMKMKCRNLLQGLIMTARITDRMMTIGSCADRCRVAAVRSLYKQKKIPGEAFCERNLNSDADDIKEGNRYGR